MCRQHTVARNMRLLIVVVPFAGIGVARWTKALGDLQGLGLRLDRSNMEALFRSAVHAPVSDTLLCIFLPM